jgi:hypothetical protein
VALSAMSQSESYVRLRGGQPGARHKISQGKAAFLLGPTLWKLFDLITK